MADHDLDARGLWCPEPVMMLHSRVRDMSAGDIVTVRATDPSTRRDIARFCQFLGHTLLASEENDGEFVFRIQKSGASTEAAGAGPARD
jgi:tRNA 2-thiouridine synthesizing protein A